MRGQLIIFTVAVLVLFLAAIYLNKPAQPLPRGLPTAAVPASKTLAPRRYAHPAQAVSKKVAPSAQPSAVEDVGENEPPQAVEAISSTEELVRQAEITAPVPSSEDPLNLVKWSAESALNIPLDLTADDNVVCPAFIVSYGDAPTTNIKVEHKAWGKNFDTTGCRRLSADLAFRGK